MSNLHDMLEKGTALNPTKKLHISVDIEVPSYYDQKDIKSLKREFEDLAWENNFRCYVPEVKIEVVNK